MMTSGIIVRETICKILCVVSTLSKNVQMNTKKSQTSELDELKEKKRQFTMVMNKISSHFLCMHKLF